MDRLNPLEPCPFCGGDELSHGVEMRYPDDIAHVQCHDCDAFVTAPTEAEAITAWNTRSQTPLERQLLEALEMAMEWIKGWDVGFLFDDEWPADEEKIRAAIAQAKEQP